MKDKTSRATDIRSLFEESFKMGEKLDKKTIKWCNKIAGMLKTPQDVEDFVEALKQSAHNTKVTYHNELDKAFIFKGDREEEEEKLE